ncbi:LMBR1 domain-containing protein 2-like protein [Smittium culicis]|uniref:LMBR1 domain-containing protein 2-like protein n=1 Tax=Smittium culicis TaxID=133412 RepID=A0A1R1YR79_9FUNG|nr:LMBR1 domain-containing protein 2-like protein [Smittium culicis]
MLFETLSVICFIASVATLSRYANPKTTSIPVYILASLSWFLPTAAIFLLPFDISSTSYRDCKGPDCQKPKGYLESATSYFIWRCLYWTLFFLTWVILPISSGYVESGHISRKLKIKQAIRNHIRYNLFVGFILLIILFIITIKGYLSWHNLTAFVMVAANSWGIILIVTFMGVGLVRIPRIVKHYSNPQYLLSNLEKTAVSLRNSVEDSELDLIESLHTFWAIPNRDDTFNSIYPFFKTIETENSDLFKRYRQRIETYNNPVQSTQNINEEYLASIRKNISISYLKFQVNSYQWDTAKKSAFFYQDLVAAKSSHYLDSSIEPIKSWPTWKKNLAYIWYLQLAPYIYFALYALFTTISIAILQSEAMVTIYPKWTIIGALFRYCKNNSFLLEVLFFPILTKKSPFIIIHKRNLHL